MGGVLTKILPCIPWDLFFDISEEETSEGETFQLVERGKSKEREYQNEVDTTKGQLFAVTIGAQKYNYISSFIKTKKQNKQKQNKTKQNKTKIKTKTKTKNKNKKQKQKQKQKQKIIQR